VFSPTALSPHHSWRQKIYGKATALSVNCHCKFRDSSGLPSTEG